MAVAFVVVGLAVGLAVGYRLGTLSVRISPMATSVLERGDARVSLTYSRPYMRDRYIFGGLVPLGEVWRTGANEATALSTNVDLLIGGAEVPAGDYTLFTIPESETWTLIINRQTGQWGTEYDEGQDLIRVQMEVEPTNWLVELFTMRIDSAGLGAELLIEWEYTRARVLIRLQDT